MPMELSIREIQLIQPHAGKRGNTDFVGPFPYHTGPGIPQSPADFEVSGIHAFIRYIQPGTFLNKDALGIHVGLLGKGGLLTAREQDRSKETLGKIVQCLPTVCVVYGGPACYRPAVVHLPIDSPHATTPVTAPVLHSVAYCLCLKQLGSVQEVVEVLRITESGEVHDLAVCRLVAPKFSAI